MAFTYTVKKGDTLNSISARYGFSNYKAAGISSVPSGNFDVIREGDSITMQNYDPSKVSTFNGTAPTVVSSVDNQQMFKTDKAKLDELMQKHDTAQQAKNSTVSVVSDIANPDGTRTVRYSDGHQEIVGVTKNTDGTETYTPQKDAGKGVTYDTPEMALYAMSREDDQKKVQVATARAEQDRADYLASLSTRLADIDSVAQATIQRIEASTARRISEQNRINAVNTDRVKAYGLGTALYNPVMYSDAVTERERKGAEVISQLESERNSSINAAIAAASQGKSALLADKMKALNDIEDRMRSKLQEVEQESDKQYKLLVEVRKQEEAKRVKLVEDQMKKLAAYVSLHKDEYKNLSTEELQKRVMQDAQTTGLGFADVLTTVQKSLATDYDTAKKKLENEKLTAEIARTQQQTKTEVAQTAKEWANADKIRNGGGGTDWTTAQKQKLEQAGLLNAPRQQQLDYLVGDPDEYEKKYPKGTTNTLRDRTRKAGFDYDRMRAAGYSDKDIEASLPK